MKQIQRSKINDPVVADAIMAVADEGVISPEAVVKAAKPKNSPLHSFFEWDDSSAAHEWRIHQARNLIRVVVQTMELPDKTERDVQVFVSLPSDRNENGGYRVMAEVMDDEALKRELLNSALEELKIFRNKYKELVELVNLFAEIDRISA